ncbi:MAG: HAD-IB family hydrolase [Parachlamydiaceae bacterium]
MNHENKPIVAAFDFDKTLTTQDTLLPFVRLSLGRWKTYLNLVRVFPFAIGFLLGLQTRQQVKERFLTACFKGCSMSALQARGKEFVKQEISRFVKIEGVERLKWHQQQGHRCILVSANLNIFIPYWAESVGIPDVVCTILEEDGEEKATGKIAGLNCWGKEKVNRLQKILGRRENVILYAYGDSQGDKELLDYADYAFYRSFFKENLETSKAKTQG